MKRLFLIAFAGAVVCWCEATRNSTTPPSQPSSRSNPRYLHHDPLLLNLSSTSTFPVDNLHSGLGHKNPDGPVSVFDFLLPNNKQHVFRVTRFNLSAMSPQSPLQSLLQRHISSTTHSPIPNPIPIPIPIPIPTPSDSFHQHQLPNNPHFTPVPIDISPFLYTTTTNAPPVPVAAPFRSRQQQPQTQLQHRHHHHFQAPKSSNIDSYVFRSQQQQQQQQQPPPPPQMGLLGDYGEELHLLPPARTHQTLAHSPRPRPHAKGQLAGEYGSRLTQSQRTGTGKPTQTHTFQGQGQGTRRQQQKQKPTPVAQQRERLPQSNNQRPPNHPKKTPPPQVFGFGAHDDSDNDNDPFEDMENQIEGLQQLPKQHQKYLLHLLQHLQTHQTTKPSRRTPAIQHLRRPPPPSPPPRDYTKVPVVQVTPARLHSEHHSSRLQSLRPQQGQGHFHQQQHQHQLPTNQPFLQRQPPQTWSATADEEEDDYDDEYYDEKKLKELDKEPAETRTSPYYASLTPPDPPAPIHSNQRNQFPQHHSMVGYSQAQLFQPFPQQHNNNNNPVYAPWNSTLFNQPQRVSQTKGQFQGPVLIETEKVKEKQVEESKRLENLSTTTLAPIAQRGTNKTTNKPKKKYKLKFEFDFVDPNDLDELEERPIVVSKPKPK